MRSKASWLLCSTTSLDPRRGEMGQQPVPNEEDNGEKHESWLRFSWNVIQTLANLLAMLHGEYDTSDHERGGVDPD